MLADARRQLHYQSGRACCTAGAQTVRAAAGPIGGGGPSVSAPGPATSVRASKSPVAPSPAAAGAPSSRRVQPLLGLELDAAAHWQTLRLGTVVQCLRATAARNGCPLAPLYCIGTAGSASPPAPASGRVASPATATEPTPKALKRSASAADLTPTGGDIRSFFKK
jgi:hypothetical protein